MQKTEIHYTTGDATSPEADGPKIIVHVCNDIGAWGKGFVMAISKRWPEPEKRFREWYRGEESSAPFALGNVQFVQVAFNLTVANLIGQRGIATRQRTPPVRYEAIREGLEKVAAFAKEQVASVHMPRIGCGLAGGKWDEMAPIIEQALCSQGIPVTVYDFAPGR